jgi:GcrA cell cycle regulator
MQATNWPPEHSEALREYLARGMSYSLIADAINAKFNSAYSRNAAIGRAKRMGLSGSGPAGPDHSREQPELLSRPRPPQLHKISERYATTLRRSMPVFERVDGAKLRCADVDPRHLSLADLERGDCRYPYGGDEEGEAITFCGHPRRPGSSYCTAHFHLTRGPGAAPVEVTDQPAPGKMEAA